MMRKKCKSTKSWPDPCCTCCWCCYKSSTTRCLFSTILVFHMLHIALMPRTTLKSEKNIHSCFITDSHRTLFLSFVHLVLNKKESYWILNLSYHTCMGYQKYLFLLSYAFSILYQIKLLKFCTIRIQVILSHNIFSHENFSFSVLEHFSFVF